MTGHFARTHKERLRAQVLERVARKELSLKNAARLLQLSYRQCKRLLARLRREGAQGVVHRARGKTSNHAEDAEMKQAMLNRYRERYPDFGPTLASEKLSQEGYQVDHETLRQWLLQAGLWGKRRPRSQHRTWSAAAGAFRRTGADGRFFSSLV
jgi:molybdenum-dependent DNA-binding transcriptional regulator ModE